MHIRSIMLWKMLNAVETKLKKPHQEIDEAFLCLILRTTSEPCQALFVTMNHPQLLPPKAEKS